MGKTSKPLTIVAFPPCDEWDEIAKLEKQGHKVIRVIEQDEQGNRLNIWTDLLLSADIVLGSNCWRMSNAHKSYLPLALKEARMLKYDTYEKRADSKKRASVAADLNSDESESSK